MEIKLTSKYSKWKKSLNREAKSIIDAKLTYAITRGFRNSKSLGRGLYELKIDFGPGYRIYFGKKENRIIIILAGGTKKGQLKEIYELKKYGRKLNKKRRLEVKGRWRNERRINKL